MVTANGCGIAVPSLAAIPDALARVTPAGHEAMRSRSRELGEEVRQGRYLLEAAGPPGIVTRHPAGWIGVTMRSDWPS